MTYDTTGKRIRTENLAGQATTTEWDCCHKVLETRPDGSVTTWDYADGKGPAYDYDANGRLTKRTWARGIDTFYAYDGWGNLTNTTYSDTTPTITLVYDTMGRQTEARDAAGVTTFSYDVFASLTNETVVGVAGTNILERFHDTFGRDAGYALNGVRQSTLGYNLATGRLSSMAVPAEQSNNSNNRTIEQFTWSYIPGSDLKSSLAYPNGLTASWTYGNRGELLQVRNAFPTNVVSQFDYTYDAAGRRVACTKSGSAFETPDTNSYLYDTRSELTNAVATVDSSYRYGYEFDDIGNRRSSLERGVQSAEYTANGLNQYTAVDDFVPQFDDDGNQTLVKTATGIWQVTYNGENRPILWTCLESRNHTISSQSIVTMSYDRMGRRVTKNDQRFVYDGYLQIADNACNVYVWDPTELAATCPLFWRHDGETFFYTHDGNKNVGEVMVADGTLAAHYEYAPFGALPVKHGVIATANPWRFSSEYAEDDTATLYYNYRHYEPMTGRWLRRDPIEEQGFGNLYGFAYNSLVSTFDILGCQSFRSRVYINPDLRMVWDYKDGVYVLSAPGTDPKELDQYKQWFRKMVKFDQIVDIDLKWSGYCIGNNKDEPVIEDASVDFNVVNQIDSLEVSVEDLPLGKKGRMLLSNLGVDINLQIAAGWSVKVKGNDQTSSSDKKCRSKTFDFEVFESIGVGVGVVKPFKGGATVTVGIDTEKVQYSKSLVKQSITITQCCCPEYSLQKVSGGQHIDGRGIDRSKEGLRMTEWMNKMRH